MQEAAKAEWPLVTGSTRNRECILLRNVVRLEEEPEHEIMQPADTWISAS